MKTALDSTTGLEEIKCAGVWLKGTHTLSIKKRQLSLHLIQLGFDRGRPENGQEIFFRKDGLQYLGQSNLFVKLQPPCVSILTPFLPYPFSHNRTGLFRALLFTCSFVIQTLGIEWTWLMAKSALDKHLQFFAYTYINVYKCKYIYICSCPVSDL